MRRNYSLIPSMIGSSSGIIWSFDDPYELFNFDENNQLFISNNTCNERLFCLCYSSSIWTFNDSLSIKYVFMGEFKKWTLISQQRFSSLTFNFDNT
jgi:hypothetical protein